MFIQKFFPCVSKPEICDLVVTVFFRTHELPKFDYWLWQTITGVTGILLVFHVAVMYTFAQPQIRQNCYNWFSYVHSTYPIFFVLMFLHGMGRLIQPPFTYYFALGPIIIFTIDSLISLTRKKIQINVIRADILPSCNAVDDIISLGNNFYFRRDKIGIP